jgi:hypothetical protein
MRPREILKSRVSKMPFPAFFFGGGGDLCMERVRIEEKINEARPSLMTILLKYNFYRKPNLISPASLMSKEM